LEQRGGIGDDSTTFNLPDFETNNLFPRAADDDAELSNEGGKDTHVLTTSEMPSHTPLKIHIVTL